MLKACNCCEIILLNGATGNAGTQITQRSGGLFIGSKTVNSEEKGSHHSFRSMEEGDEQLVSCVLVTLPERERHEAVVEGRAANGQPKAKCSLPYKPFAFVC